MKTDNFKTDVKILFHEKENDLFAYFPNSLERKDKHGKYYMAYSHIGQHTSAHEDYANESRCTTVSESAELIRELQSIGYNLNIVN